MFLSRKRPAVGRHTIYHLGCSPGERAGIHDLEPLFQHVPAWQSHANPAENDGTHCGFTARMSDIHPVVSDLLGPFTEHARKFHSIQWPLDLLSLSRHHVTLPWTLCLKLITSGKSNGFCAEQLWPLGTKTIQPWAPRAVFKQWTESLNEKENLVKTISLQTFEWLTL